MHNNRNEGTWKSEEERSSQKSKRTLRQLRMLHIGYSESISSKQSNDSLEMTENLKSVEKEVKHTDTYASDHRNSTSSNKSDHWSIASSEEIGPTEKAGKLSQFYRKFKKRANSSYGSDYEQVFPGKDAIKRSNIQDDVKEAEKRFKQAYQYLDNNIKELSDRGLGGKRTKEAFNEKYKLLYQQFDESKKKLDNLDRGKKRERYEKSNENFESTNELIAMENILRRYIKWKGYGKLFAGRLIGKSDATIPSNVEIKIGKNRLHYASLEVGKIYKEKGDCNELNRALQKELLFKEQYKRLAGKDKNDLKNEAEAKRICNEWRELGWHDSQSLSKEDKIKIRKCEYRQIALEEGVSSALSDMLSDSSSGSLCLADLDYLHVENSNIKKRISSAFEDDEKDNVLNNLKPFSDWVLDDFSADFKAAMNVVPSSEPHILVRIYYERIKENIDRLYKRAEHLQLDLKENLSQLSDQIDTIIKQRVAYAADECFNREFTSSIRKEYKLSETDLANLLEELPDDLSSIDRHYKIFNVSDELKTSLAIAKGKAKNGVIRQEEALYKYKGQDRDTTKEFQENFKIIPGKELASKNERRFEIETESKEGVPSRSPENRVSSFRNTIIIKENNVMETEGWSNYNYTDFPQSEMGWFHHCRLALEKAGKTFSDVTYTKHKAPIVNNSEAIATMWLFVQDKESNQYGEKEKRFPAGSDGFYAYLGLEVGQGKGFMPAQHQIALKGRRLTSVTVKVSSSSLSTECEFNV